MFDLSPANLFISFPQEIMNGNLERETYIGHEAQLMRGVLALKHPIKNGITRNWDEMEKASRNSRQLFVYSIIVAPSRRRWIAVLCVSALLKFALPRRFGITPSSSCAWLPRITQCC